jgi:hypothetical protein
MVRHIKMKANYRGYRTQHMKVILERNCKQKKMQDLRVLA